MWKWRRTEGDRDRARNREGERGEEEREHFDGGGYDWGRWIFQFSSLRVAFRRHSQKKGYACRILRMSEGGRVDMAAFWEGKG